MVSVGGPTQHKLCRRLHESWKQSAPSNASGSGKCASCSRPLPRRVRRYDDRPHHRAAPNTSSALGSGFTPLASKCRIAYRARTFIAD